MVRHLRALRVHQTASRMLETGRLAAEPPWYRTVGAIPPSTTLVRPLPVQLYERKASKGGKKKPARMFQPQKIVYPEDRLRAQFFKDHPWELARPRILVENQGKDHSYYWWGKLVQVGKQLDGESVVQRQMWLMENDGKSERDAYDIARREFYDLRMQEDLERRVAKEEARAVGANFHKSYIEIGTELENTVLDDWRRKALAAIQLKQSRTAAAYSGTEEPDEEEASMESGLEGAAAAPVGTAPVSRLPPGVGQRM